jgi:hypothetical protein
MLRKLIKEVTLAVFITASCHFGVQLYDDYSRYSEMQRLSEENVFIVTACRFGPPLHLCALFYIELCLIVTLIASRLTRLWNTLFSIIGLSGAVITYIFWWQVYFRVMEASGATGPDVIKNYAYLVGGTFVDVAIAGGIALLVVLNVLDAAASSFRLDPEIGNHDSSKGPSQT